MKHLSEMFLYTLLIFHLLSVSNCAELGLKWDQHIETPEGLIKGGTLYLPKKGIFFFWTNVA